MIDLEMKMGTDGEWKMGFNIKGLNESVVDDIEKLEISKFSIIGHLFGIGENKCYIVIYS